MVKQAVKVLIRTRPTADFASKNLVIDQNKGSIQVCVEKDEAKGTINNQTDSWKFNFEKLLHNATQDEVYMFLEGAWVIEVGSRTFEVESGDIVLIEAGEFHRVHNTAKFEQLYFMCVFNGKREKTSIGMDAHCE